MFGLFKKKSEAPTPVPSQLLRSSAEPPRAKAPNHFAAPWPDFERYLLAFHRREIPVRKFREEFFNAQLFVLSPDPVFPDAQDEIGWLYQAISQDFRYGHYVRIPQRICRCLDYFDVSVSRKAVEERLCSYYLFIGVVDDVIDSR